MGLSCADGGGAALLDLSLSWFCFTKTQESTASSSLILSIQIPLGSHRGRRLSWGCEERNKNFLERPSSSSPFGKVPCPSAHQSFLLTGHIICHEVGSSQEPRMCSFGCDPDLLHVFPSAGPELCPQDPLHPYENMMDKVCQASQHG